MAKNNYYAVRQGRSPGIYRTWDECKEQVDGYSGAEYKKFRTLPEAQEFVKHKTKNPFAKLDSWEYVEKIELQVENELKKLEKKSVIAFTDGSYDPEMNKGGFSAVIIENNEKAISLYKAVTDSKALELRNIAAELEGVKEAVEWAIAYGKNRIKIYHDYEGISKWADGSWQAKKDITRQYVKFLKENNKYIKIEFCKVPAHSGIKYNELADELAKKALTERDYLTEVEEQRVKERLTVIKAKKETLER